jgi:hypothetical protein
LLNKRIIIKWLESNQGAEADELKEHKKQLEEIVNPIMTKLYSEGNSDGASSHKHYDYPL